MSHPLPTNHIKAIVPSPPSDGKVIYLDIETRMVNFRQAGWQRGTPILFASTWDKVGKWRTWYSDTLPQLKGYLSGALLVTWNGDNFDLPILLAQGGLQEGDTISLDLMKIIYNHTGCRYNLNEVAQANDLAGKSMSAEQCIEHFFSDDPLRHAMAVAYCQQDVRILISLLRQAFERDILLPVKRIGNNIHAEALFSVRIAPATQLSLDDEVLAVFNR